MKDVSWFWLCQMDVSVRVDDRTDKSVLKFISTQPGVGSSNKFAEPTPGLEIEPLRGSDAMATVFAKASAFDKAPAFAKAMAGKTAGKTADESSR